MKVTLSLPDDLASQLAPLDESETARVLELGLRRRNGTASAEFEELSDVLETLAALPTPEEILALRPSPELQERVAQLLERNREGGLSESEARWWRQYEFLEHLIRTAKARAAARLAQN